MIKTNEYLFYPYLYYNVIISIPYIWYILCGSIRWQVSHHCLIHIPVILWFLLWRKILIYLLLYFVMFCTLYWSIRLYTIVPNNCLRNRIYLLPYKNITLNTYLYEKYLEEKRITKQHIYLAYLAFNFWDKCKDLSNRNHRQQKSLKCITGKSKVKWFFTKQSLRVSTQVSGTYALLFNFISHSPWGWAPLSSVW